MASPKSPPKPPKPRKDLMARALAKNVRDAYGVQSAVTLDLSDELGSPRGWIPVSNIAFRRALGTDLPNGRLTEISGWEGTGKSTLLDETFADVQEAGGLGVLIDTERARNRPYMVKLGVQPESMIWIDGQTIEVMFDEIEVLVRTVRSMNAIAWVEALKRAGVKTPPLNEYTFAIYDPADMSKNRKPVAKYRFAQWSRAAAGSLLEWQKAQKIQPSGIRTIESRGILRPVVIHSEDKEDRKAALKAWDAGKQHDLAQAADRPVAIGWDSVAATPTEAEMEGDARAQHVASAAKVIKRNFRRLVQLIDDEAIAMILVNQRYEKIELGFGAGFGPKQSETYGGGGIKFHTSLRVELTKKKAIYSPGKDKRQGWPPCGQQVEVYVPKNKLSNPFKRETYGLMFGEGTCNAWTIHEDLKERGIIRVGGGWSRFTDPTVLGPDDKSFRGWVELNDIMALDPAVKTNIHEIYMEGGR